MIQTLTEPRRTGAYLLSEANGNLSRESITIAAGSGKLVPGTVIGKVTSASSAIADPGSENTGTASIGTITVSPTALDGDYTVVVTAAKDGDKAAKFTVTDPDGNAAEGSMGVKFEALGLSFTITDGVTGDGTAPAAEDDSWTITVTANHGEWVPYDENGTNDGRRTASGILYAAVDATDYDQPAVAHVRQCEVDANELTGLDDNAVADLLAVGVIVRGL